VLLCVVTDISIYRHYRTLWWARCLQREEKYEQRYCNPSKSRNDCEWFETTAVNLTSRQWKLADRSQIHAFNGSQFCGSNEASHLHEKIRVFLMHNDNNYILPRDILLFKGKITRKSTLWRVNERIFSRGTSLYIYICMYVCVCIYTLTDI